ncbi:uncharacterized protein LOC105203006 [Solenopsis invicta]
MEKVAFFVLALIAVVVANEIVEEMAKKFETDSATVQKCLDDTGITMEELGTSLKEWAELKDEDINEMTKQSLMKYVNFLACMMEKNEMMIDSKLVVDKIVESAQNDKDLLPPVPKEVLTECLTALNENSEISREDRVFGLMFCMMDGQTDKK